MRPEELRDCLSCRHNKAGADAEPCVTCIKYADPWKPKWEAASQKPDGTKVYWQAAIDAIVSGTGVVKSEAVAPRAWFTVDEINNWAEGKLAQGTTPEDMATQGVKFDADKPRMDLLDAYAIEELAKVLAFGAKKYDAHNWRKGITKGRLIAAALRHLFAYLRGENVDPETGLSHVAHAMCCCMFLLGLEHRPELDDRWKSEQA